LTSIIAAVVLALFAGVLRSKRLASTPPESPLLQPVKISSSFPTWRKQP
jgi:hypothetical protein